MNSAAENKDQLSIVYRETYADPVLFCRTFLPHWFPEPMSWVHRGVLALLLRKTDFLLKFGEERWPNGTVYNYGQQDLDKIIKFFVWRPDRSSKAVPLFEASPDGLHLSISRFNAVICPRGFGKTTLINAANLFKILFQERKFLVYLSETRPHSIEQLGNVKRELEVNEAVINVFGNVVPDRNDPAKWREDFAETLTGILITAKGRGGQVRGMNHNGQRPDDITIDDVEDKESVKTEDQRHKTKVWFMADVKPALPRVGKQGCINALGTILHHDSLLSSFVGDRDWITVKFGALDPDGEPIWVKYMTIEGFEKEKLSYIRQGLLAEFYMEFMSEISNAETRKFPSQFIYKSLTRDDFVGVALACDPAISDSITADFCCFAVTGMTERGQHHVLEATGRRGMSPREQVDEFFRLHFKWLPTKHGVESVAYQRALIHLLREEMFRAAKVHGTKAYFEILPILHGKIAKIERVEGTLAPRYSAGYISHQTIFPELESQLIDWPNGKKDFPDAVAMAITLLDPYAASAFNGDWKEGEENPLSRNQYEPLEEMMLGDSP